MAKPRADDRDAARTNDELYNAVDKLNQRVEILIRAIDELHDEVQWRNNELRGRRDSPLSPFVLRSMPADPTTDDWQLNRVPPEEIEAIRSTIAPPAEHAAPPSTALDAKAGQSEDPDLRQILAAFILLSSDACAADVEATYDWLLVWACQEFDVEVLRQSLSEYVIADDESDAVPGPPPERQRQLFSEETNVDQSSAEVLDEHST